MILLSLALATQVTWHTEPCPLGEGPARVFEKVSANTHGGWDSDLASYSSEGQWREFALATCSENLYTVYARDIGQPLSPEQAKAAQARLAEISARTDPDTLQVWDRYLIAAEMYGLQGASPKALFELYMDASWTARDAAVGVYLGLEGPKAARELLNEGRAELDKELDPTTRKVLLHNLARVAHRGGWPVERDHYLRLFEEVGALTDREREVLDTFRHANVVEARLQELALVQVDLVLAGTIEDPQERARMGYLRADLLRRLRRLDEAKAGFDAVQKDPNLQADLIGVARFLESTIPQYQ